MKNVLKRKRIFEIFSKNLEWTKSHSAIKFTPDFNNGYICPLCFDPFFSSDLLSQSPNPLTLEDVPPKSLGGTPKILTCQKCNSKSGHELDNHLLNRLMEIDSREFLPNSKVNASFECNGVKVNGAIEIDEEGKFIMDIHSQRSNPSESDLFIRNMLIPREVYGSVTNFEKVLTECKYNSFQISPFEHSNQKRAHVALLRIGYLLAYSKLGNSFLINGSLYRVREQIANPTKTILPEVFWFNYDFPKEMLGINLVTLPKELRCFLVIFNLVTKSKERQFAIALPGFTSPGIKIYENIDNMLCRGRNGFQHCQLIHIEDIDIVKVHSRTWWAHQYWQKYCVD